MLLLVVNPTDDWKHTVHERAVVHTVLTMKVECIGIDLVKHVERVDNRVLVTEKSIDALAFLVCNALFPLP